VCRFRIAAGVKTRRRAVVSGALVRSVTKLASITFWSLAFSYWFDKPLFHNWGKTCYCAHYTFLLGFPTGCTYKPSVAHDKNFLGDSYIVNFIHDATKRYYERGKHGFMHLNNIKFPLFMLKVLKLHLFCLPMLVASCFNNLFSYKILFHRKQVRLKGVSYFLFYALFCFKLLFLMWAFFKIMAPSSKALKKSTLGR
jgi:hypothetical protein